MPASSESTSTQLIRDAQADVPEAWHKLYYIYKPLVQKWCWKCGLNDADSLDVTQNVFMRLAKYLKSYEHDKQRAKFRTWFHTVTVNCIRDFARERSNKTVATGGTAANDELLHFASIDNTSIDDSSSPQALDREKALITQRVMSLIQTDFSERTWNAFLRSAVNGESTAAIAEDLGLSVGAIRQAKSRVLRRLREELAELA